MNRSTSAVMPGQKYRVASSRLVLFFPGCAELMGEWMRSITLVRRLSFSLIISLPLCRRRPWLLRVHGLLGSDAFWRYVLSSGSDLFALTSSVVR